MEHITEELKRFVLESAGWEGMKLTSMTKLEEDLGMYGDDADEFIEEFGKHFHVDVSKFDISAHFSPEFWYSITGNILEALGLKKRRKPQNEKQLTLGDLEEARRKYKLE